MIDRAGTGRDDDLAADLAAVDESFSVVSDADIPAVRGDGDRERHLDRMWNIAS